MVGKEEYLLVEIEKYKARGADIVISDILMQVMHRFQFCRE